MKYFKCADDEERIELVASYICSKKEECIPNSLPAEIMAQGVDRAALYKRNNPSETFKEISEGSPSINNFCFDLQAFLAANRETKIQTIMVAILTKNGGSIPVDTTPPLSSKLGNAWKMIGDPFLPRTVQSLVNLIVAQLAVMLKLPLTLLLAFLPKTSNPSSQSRPSYQNPPFLTSGQQPKPQTCTVLAVLTCIVSLTPIPRLLHLIPMQKPLQIQQLPMLPLLRPLTLFLVFPTKLWYQ